MIKVKLFGLLRLDTGIKEFGTDAKTVKELRAALLKEAKSRGAALSAEDIDGCIVIINGVQQKKNSRLKDGDEVMLMSPVCGG